MALYQVVSSSFSPANGGTIAASFAAAWELAPPRDDEDAVTDRLQTVTIQKGCPREGRGNIGFAKIFHQNVRKYV